MDSNKGHLQEDREGESTEIGKYCGQRNTIGERHGKGWAIFPNMDIYKGNYLNGLRQGKGVYVFKNGARYEGAWRKGVKYGFGTIIYPDGSKYEGEWKNDLKYGFGAYYYPNNDVYEGGWYKGEKHGLGTYVYASVKTTFMGNWFKGSKEGPGQLIYPHYRYHGSWSNDVPTGRGYYIFETDSMLEGTYICKNKKKDILAENDKDMLSDSSETKTVWRVNKILPYCGDLLPPQPMPLPIQDSLPSITDDFGRSNMLTSDGSLSEHESEAEDGRLESEVRDNLSYTEQDG